MQSSDIPSKSPKIWGVDAAGTFIRSIPQTSSDPAAASFDLGFPPQTFTDEDAGGTPPDGRDINGAFNFLSAWARWAQAGAPIGYDPTFQAAVGGYPMGAIVASAVTFGLFWQSTVENNTTNPDSGGAGWRKFALTGSLVGEQVFSASGTYTPTIGTNSVEVTVVGAGGGGGGSAAMGSGQFGAGGGGGSGGWAVARLLTGFAGLAVTIGIGGTGGSGGNGGNGSASSFGSGLLANGGGGGAFGVAVGGMSCQVGGAGGSSNAANILSTTGAPGGPAVAVSNGNQLSGFGGSTPYGAGGASRNANTNPGINAGGPGGGGGGGIGQSGAAAQAGGNGANGLIIIREYA